MDLQTRIELMAKLGQYMLGNDEEWVSAKWLAEQKNAWFTSEFIELATINIAQNFLQKDALEKWVSHYPVQDLHTPKNVGLVMAGNIPLVGFHDFLTLFISGHHQTIKLSSKDDVLMPAIVNWMLQQHPMLQERIQFSETLKNKDAYIATGSNHAGKYFELYFGKYPHLIRKNKTSVAILDGSETEAELKSLSDDIHLYFGLGCRNVTHLYVPEGYNFEPLLHQFNAYQHFSDHHKYKNNYDYQLSLLLLNHVFYMTQGSTLLSENHEIFSPISQVYYSYYPAGSEVMHDENFIRQKESIQAIIGRKHLAFGQAQSPGLMDYADQTDTFQFLLSL